MARALSCHFAQPQMCMYSRHTTFTQHYSGILLILYNCHKMKLTIALRHTPIPLSIRLAGSAVWSLQCVAYITGVGHYRVVGCTGETALTICGSTRITTTNSWSWLRVHCTDAMPYIICISAQVHMKLLPHSLTCFTLCSRPPHITGASVRSCASPSILTGTGTDGCRQMSNEGIDHGALMPSRTDCTSNVQHTAALRDTPTPLSIRLAGSTVWSLQCVAYITGVGHYRVVVCTGETALAICGCTRITTTNAWTGWESMHIVVWPEDNSLT